MDVYAEFIPCTRTSVSFQCPWNVHGHDLSNGRADISLSPLMAGPLFGTLSPEFHFRQFELVLHDLNFELLHIGSKTLLESISRL